MFNIELSDTELFKTSFEAISSIIDETSIVIDSEGFRVRALDRSHISFVNLMLEPTVFDSFECTEPEKINIDTDEFMKILKRMKRDDLLKLSCEEGNFIIKFIGDVDREFKIRLIDIEYEMPQPPALEPPVAVNVPSDLVKDTLTDMELFSDKLYIQVDGDYFRVISDGEFGEADVRYLHGEEVNESVRACYNIDKLKAMFKASKFSEDVEVSFGNDMPLILKFQLPTGDGEISFLLAPRLEQDE